MEHGKCPPLRVIDLAPNQRLMFSPNGRETRRVTETLTNIDWASLSVKKGSEVVHALIGKDVASNLGVELTGALRQAGKDRKVIMIALSGRPSDLRRRLAGRIPPTMEGITYAIIGKKALLEDPNRVVEITEGLLTASMPKMSLETEDI